MTLHAETSRLIQKLAESREQRQQALNELQTLRSSQEHVPLARIPGVGSALRVLKRLYMLPHIQSSQQTLTQLSVAEDETVALALTVINAASAQQLEAMLQGQNALEQSQAGLTNHIGQISAALAELQETSAGIGSHLNLINVAVLGLQTHVNQINSSLSDMQNGTLAELQRGYDDLVQAHNESGSALAELQHFHDELGHHVTQISDVVSGVQRAQGELTDMVIRLGAQIGYLPTSINELVADLRREIEHVAANNRTDNQHTPPSSTTS